MAGRHEAGEFLLEELKYKCTVCKIGFNDEFEFNRHCYTRTHKHNLDVLREEESCPDDIALPALSQLVRTWGVSLLTPKSKRVYDEYIDDVNADRNVDMLVDGFFRESMCNINRELPSDVHQTIIAIYRKFELQKAYSLRTLFAKLTINGLVVAFSIILVCANVTAE